MTEKILSQYSSQPKTEDLYQSQTYPILVIISGPSGVGKDTVARKLIKRRPEDFYFVVTATTRRPRDNEVHGIDYFFVSNDEFARMIEEDELLEYAVVYQQYKGIPKQQVRDALASGKNVIMRLDVQGTATVHNLIPNALTVSLRTPTEEDLVRRLIKRESDSAEGINLRIATARKEMRKMKEFDYSVENAENEQEKAVDLILSIIDAARCQVHQEPIIL